MVIYRNFAPYSWIAATGKWSQKSRPLTINNPELIFMLDRGTDAIQAFLLTGMHLDTACLAEGGIRKIGQAGNRDARQFSVRKIDTYAENNIRFEQISLQGKAGTGGCSNLSRIMQTRCDSSTL